MRFGFAAGTGLLQGREGSTRHPEDGRGEGLDVVFGQGEGLYLGELVLRPDMRDHLPQGLEGVVELVHALPFTLITLESPQVPLFAAPGQLGRGSGHSRVALLVPFLFAP